MTEASSQKKMPTRAQLTPPAGVKSACKTGIKMVEDGMGGSGLEAATVREARAIVRGTPITIAKARKMVRWWGRNARFLDYDKDSPAWVAALLWGGRAGLSWSRRLKRTFDAKEEKAAQGSISSGDFVSWTTDKGGYVGQVSSVRSSGRVAVVSSSGGSETIEASSDNQVALVRVFIDNQDGTYTRSDRSVPVRVSMLRKRGAPETKNVSDQVRETLAKKAKEHNEKYSAASKKTSTRTLIAVFRRGLGAYSGNPGSVRPTVSSPTQWAYARVNSFLYVLRTGKFRGGKHDQDLLPKGHPQSTKSADEPTIVKGPACRQANETYEECVSRKISELMGEEDYAQDRAVAAASSMCENGCSDKSSRSITTSSDDGLMSVVDNAFIVDSQEEFDNISAKETPVEIHYKINTPFFYDEKSPEGRDVKIRGPVYVGNDDYLDRHDELVTMSAIMDAWKGYSQNPVILYNHSKTYGVIGRMVSVTKGSFNGMSVPIGTAVIDAGEKDITRKIRKGMLKAFSIGFIAKAGVKECKDDDTCYMKFTKIDWVETSVVDVPASPDALFSVQKSVLTGASSQKYGMMDDEEDKREVERDVFTTVAEAESRAEQLGCEGIHSHSIDGPNGKLTVYMPCNTHDAYTDATGDDLETPTSYQLGYHEEEEKPKSAKTGGCGCGCSGEKSKKDKNVVRIEEDEDFVTIVYGKSDEWEGIDVDTTGGPMDEPQGTGYYTDEDDETKTVKNPVVEGLDSMTDEEITIADSETEVEDTLPVEEETHIKEAPDHMEDAGEEMPEADEEMPEEEAEEEVAEEGEKSVEMPSPREALMDIAKALTHIIEKLDAQDEVEEEVSEIDALRAEVESYKAAEEARIKEAEMEAEVERRVAEKMASVSDAPAPARKSITQTDSTPEAPVTKANGLADWLAANLAQRGN